MDGLLRAKASHIQRPVDGEGGLCKHFHLFLAQTLVGTFSDSRPRLMAHCQMRDREEESWCPGLQSSGERKFGPPGDAGWGRGLFPGLDKWGAVDTQKRDRGGFSRDREPCR